MAASWEALSYPQRALLLESDFDSSALQQGSEAMMATRPAMLCSVGAAGVFFSAGQSLLKA